MTKNKKIIVTSLSILVVSFAIYALYNSAVASTVESRDSQRLDDLETVRAALELYHDKCGYYPGPANPGNSCRSYHANNTWAGMSAAIIGSGLGVGEIPTDPTSGRYYFYSTNAAGTSYVLGAELENPNHSVLSARTARSVNGIRCAGSVYCVEE